MQPHRLTDSNIGKLDLQRGPTQLMNVGVKFKSKSVWTSFCYSLTADPVELRAPRSNVTGATYRHGNNHGNWMRVGKEGSQSLVVFSGIKRVASI